MNPVEVIVRADGAEQAGAKLNLVAEAVNHLTSKASQYFAVGTMIDKAGELGKQTFDYAANVGDLSKRYKVAGETVQSWGYAADKTGAQLGDVTSAYKQVGKAIGEVQGGNTDVMDMFRSFGVTDLSNQERVFNQLAKRIGEGGLSMKQLLDITRLMGRNVASLFPAFEEGFSDLQQQFKDLGLGIKDNVTAKIKEADDKFVEMWYRVRSAIAPITGVVAEAMTYVADGAGLIISTTKGLVTGGLKAGVKEAQDYMEQFVKSANVAAIASGKPKTDAKPNAEGFSVPFDAEVKSGVGSNAFARSRASNPIDSLQKIGLYRGGLDTTLAMKPELKQLNQQVAQAVRHLSHLEKVISDLDGASGRYIYR